MDLGDWRGGKYGDYKTNTLYKFDSFLSYIESPHKEQY